MPNTRVRKIYEFIALSGAGKKQSAFAAFQPQSDIDTRDKCAITVTENVRRSPQFDCDGVDVIRENIDFRSTAVTLDYNDGFTPQIAARWFGYLTGTAAAPTGTADTNEVQSLTRSGTVSGGTFTLSWNHEGKSVTTDTIAYDASNATILAAILKKTGSTTSPGRLFKTGDITVAGTWGTAITLTYAGRFAAANMTQVVVDDALITGGGTIEEATDTAGSNKVHVFTRTTDGTLPLFSFILGDKNGAYDDFKFGDAVVDSISINLEQSGSNLATMQVNILCNYVAERLSAYTAPACVNINPLKVEDCKVKITGGWETADVASLTANFNNNVPVEAAEAYDDIDVSVAFQRGDQPTQGFTASVYGIPSTALYVLAEAEETDGNDTDFLLQMGQNGNALSISGANTKIKFQPTRLGYAGPLQQSVINIEATPYDSPPLVYSFTGSQTATFLTASS